jgi:hypothetical protein
MTSPNNPYKGHPEKGGFAKHSRHRICLQN